MNQLLSISSSDERMKLIEEERHKGSMPMELFLRLKKYIQAEQLVLHHTPIDKVSDSQIFAGGLADLELGPFARNIMGDKGSAERISKAYRRLSKKIS